MDMIYLDKMYKELTELGEQYKHPRRKTKVNIVDKEVCREYIKRNNGLSINDESQLASIYSLYNSYLNEQDKKTKDCMCKVLTSQNSIKNIRQIFGKLKLVSRDVLDDILCDKMSMRKLRDLHIETINTAVTNDGINPNHLKDDSRPVINDQVIIHQLQSDVNDFLENIKSTANVAKASGVHNIPAYKDICTEMLGSISETMRSFDSLIA